MSKSNPRLIEYQEVLANHRHYDVIRWTVIALVYPTAFAAIAFAGARWGFTSGRAFLVSALGSLWLVAGSLVFAQIHFYGQVCMCRAHELEDEFNFRNLRHKPFSRPELSDQQPWYTRGLAWWFTIFVPVVAFAGSLVWGGVVLGQWFPRTGADRNVLGAIAGLVLLFVALVVFLV
ncbi:MAG: hypothetical protein IBX63_09535, partial [Coriobacteriia bacterium]|nr:hypothetical protein [Coriobacteriia bacterium]